VLVNSEVFDGFNGVGGALLLQRLATVEDRFGAGERFRGLSRRFAFGGGESVGADAESLKISVEGQLDRSDTDVTDLVSYRRIRWVDLIPDLGTAGGSGAEAPLGLAMIHSRLAERLIRVADMCVGR